jgi:hypothetical protein
VSEHPLDDEELEAFLSRESALSHRYRESGDEQPPAHVDEAILAASRWAVSADGKHRTGRHAGSQHGVSAHRAVTGRRKAMARWRVPLAMAAVVVVAVTLTIMIERDPELDRIYERYDSASPAESEAIRDNATVGAEVAAPQTPAPAGKGASAELTSQSSKPAPALPPAKKEVADPAQPVRDEPGATSLKATGKILRQLAEEDGLAARKRGEITDEQVVADQSVRRDQPAASGEEQVAQNVALAPTPAELFRDNVSAEVEAADRSDAITASRDKIKGRDDTVKVEKIVSTDEIANLDRARDESAFAGVSALPEPGKSLPSAVSAPARQQAFAPPPATVLEADRELAQSTQPGEIVAAESLRHPAQWIEDIEELLAQGRRAEAIDFLEEFRRAYPDYKLPPDLLSLLPADTD